MGGFKLGFGVGLSYIQPLTKKISYTPPTSVIATGFWIMEGVWSMSDSFNF